jgi:competence protein ComEC
MGGRGGLACAVALWAGLLLSLVWPEAQAAGGGQAATALALIALVPAGVALRSRGAFATSLVALSLLLAALARGLSVREQIALERSVLARGGFAWINAVVVEPAETESGTTRAVLSIRAADPPLRPGTRVRAWLPEGVSADWGDRVSALVRLSVPDPVRNPGGFDSRRAADASRIAFQGVARAARVRAAEGLARWPRATVMRWRRAIERVLRASLSPHALELVAPLMFGDRSAVDNELSAAFRSAGLTHLLALSGLHVTWLASLAAALAAACGAGVAGRTAVRGASAVLYLALAGPIPSLARASFCEALGAVGRLTQRAVDPAQLLAGGVMVLLLLRPWWAWDLGFQLSCAATTGLIAIAPALGAARGAWRPLARALGPTLGAQAISLPLLITRFHAIAWTSVVSNLVAVPLTGLMLTAAWLGALLEWLAPGMGASLLHSLEPLSIALRWIVEGAERIRGALLATGPAAFAGVAAMLGAAALAVSLPPPRSVADRAGPRSRAAHHTALAGGVLLGSALLLCATEPTIAPPEGRYWVVVLDVGQGDSIALGLGHAWWLVDAGPHTPRLDAGLSVVLPFLRWAAVRRLDALVLTHDDSDHVGGAGSILREMPVARTLAPAPREGVPGPLRRFAGTPVRLGERLVDSPALRVRWPPPPDSATSFWLHPVTSADNGAVAVLELGSGAGRTLLAADADSAVESALDVAPNLALLKVAHHGSGSSSGSSFLMRVRPRLAAISVGRNNRFGHPDPRALARLEACGVPVSRTDVSGALWIEVSDRGARAIDWRRGAWRERAGSARCVRAGGPSP